MSSTIALEEQYGANNYHPLPVVLVKGNGVYVWDEQGKKYLDMMSAYSAVSHGHCHPRLVETLCEQAKKLAICSRAYHTETLGKFLQKACQLFGFEKALPMNTGAEGVETAIKAARKWAYQVKKVDHDKAEIIVCEGNFHGRTTTVVSFSSDPQYKNGFGPLTPGFKCIPYGNSQALRDAITANTAAFLLEPIQGEAGIRIPPQGFLSEAQRICSDNNVLLLLDEIQTGLGRTGKLLACQHENIQPDGVILGKALGGGLLPVSLFLSSNEVMSVFTPGDHGSTFGGNQLASAVALMALNLLSEEKLAENSAELGSYMLAELQKINSPFIKEVRGRGLFIGIEVNSDKILARDICIALMKNGLLSKETHGTVIRLAPPLIISRQQIDDALDIIQTTFKLL